MFLIKIRLVNMSKSSRRNCISEAVVWKCSVEKVFLEISQNSQENTCAMVSFFTEHLRWLLLSFFARTVEQYQVFCKKGVLKNFTKFTEKHLRQSFLFNEVTYNFMKKKTLAHVFSCEFYEIFKNTFFLKNTFGGCF